MLEILIVLSKQDISIFKDLTQSYAFSFRIHFNTYKYSWVVMIKMMT